MYIAYFTRFFARVLESQVLNSFSGGFGSPDKSFPEGDRAGFRVEIKNFSGRFRGAFRAAFRDGSRAAFRKWGSATVHSQRRCSCWRTIGCPRLCGGARRNLTSPWARRPSANGSHWIEATAKVLFGVGPGAAILAEPSIHPLLIRGGRMDISKDLARPIGVGRG